MTIRIFNPEHDIALASNVNRFTPPHAARQLRSDLSFIPALWAEEGDFVIVEDVDTAELLYKKTRKGQKISVEFCTLQQLPVVCRDLQHERISVDVWGWDTAIRFQLLNAGVPSALLPSVETIDKIRHFSNRRMTVSLLPLLRNGIEELTCGCAEYLSEVKLLKDKMLKQKNNVLKAPWSSSGRGVRYLSTGNSVEIDELPSNLMNWINNTIERQGGIMLEPYYNKIKDFAVEFAYCNGEVLCKGVSLFQTQNGAYTGNILATEDEKRQMLSRYISLSLLDEVITRLKMHMSDVLCELTGQFSVLHFGIDMMIVASPLADSFLLHPCVEMNFRRTMGHLSLALSPLVPDNQSSMSITYEGKKYRLKIR